MITWSRLVYSLEQLSKLSNGNGAEIEFEFKGNSYIIVHYKDECYFSKLISCSSLDSQDWEWEEKAYKNIEELGKAKDFGFCLMKEWKNVENLNCRPDFDRIPLNTIIESYRNAIK